MHLLLQKISNFNPPHMFSPCLKLKGTQNYYLPQFKIDVLYQSGIKISTEALVTRQFEGGVVCPIISESQVPFMRGMVIYQMVTDDIQIQWA